MNDNLSPHLPSSPEVHPASAKRQNFWKWLSLALTILGVVLMGWGSWMYTQQYLEAIKPPPAPIIEMSLADIEQTLTPQLQPSPTVPLASATPKPAAPTTTGPNDNNAKVSDVLPTPAPTDTPVPAPADSKPAETALSLADNPLLVVSDQTTPGQTETDVTPPPAIPAETEPQSAASELPRAPIVRIAAESIKLDADVIPVGWESVTQNGKQVNVWRVADYAAGWHSNSLLPGQGGNVVLSGHHNIKGEVFRYIVDMNLGDVITLTDEAGNLFKYTVADKFIVKDKGEPDAVRRANARWIGPFNDERLTLVTCWPYNNNTHRVIVIAKPVSQP